MRSLRPVLGICKLSGEDGGIILGSNEYLEEVARAITLRARVTQAMRLAPREHAGRNEGVMRCAPAIPHHVIRAFVAVHGRGRWRAQTRRGRGWYRMGVRWRRRG